MANEFDEVLDQESAGTLPPLSSGLEKGEFDDVLDTEVTQQRDYVRNVIDIASKDNPEAAAERIRLSQSTGLPPDVVARNQQELKRREIARAIDLQRMMRDSPVLFRQMTDPTFTAAAIDDLDTLKQVERTLGDISLSTIKGAVGLPQAVVGLADIPTFGRVGKALESIGYRPGEAQRILESAFSPEMRASLARVQNTDGFFEALGTVLSEPRALSNTIIESLPLMLGGAGIARGVTSGAARLLGIEMAPLAAAAIGEGAIGGGAAAEQIREQTEDGLLTGTQSAAALASGVGTGLLGALGGKVAQRMGLGDIDTALAAGTLTGTPRAGFAKQVIGSGITEGLFEELPQSAQEQMWQNFALDRPILQGVANAAAIGLVAGAVTGGAFGTYNATVAKLIERTADAQAQVDQALSDAQRLQAAMRAAAQSQLRERSPETFQQLVEQIAADNEGAQSVFIDGQVLAQSGIDIAQAFPSLADQVNEAAFLNSTVEIPIAEVLTAVPGTPLEELFLQNAKSSPDALSQAEVEQAGEQGQQFIQQEAERVLQQAQEREAWQSEVDTVQQTIKDQLDQAGRFTSDVNEGYARLQSQFFSVMASRFGITPSEMYQRFSVKVAGQMGQGEVLNAGANQTPEFRTVSAGDTVDGRVVREGVPNTDSIGASLENYNVLPGIKEVPLSAFDPDYINSISIDKLDERTRALASEIAASGEITPLIVVQDSDGFYVLEGGHRFDALIASGAKSLPAVVVIDQDNPPATYNQKRDITQTAEFKNWFGDSKIVNNSGAPLVVYHGTDETFDVFDRKKQREGKWGKGFYFTTSEAEARNYGKNVIAVYLKADRLTDTRAGGPGGTTTGEGKTWAMKGKMTANGGDVYLVTSPTQIKSATGNQGTFDPNDPNILRQSARGTFNPQTLLISLGPQSDLSTFLHESGHFFLEVMADLAAQPDAPAQVREDMDKVRAWFASGSGTAMLAKVEQDAKDAEADASRAEKAGDPDAAQKRAYADQVRSAYTFAVENGGADYMKTVAATFGQDVPKAHRIHLIRQFHERWAESFEQYLLEGKAPSAELQPLFRQFRSWLVRVYTSLTDFMRGRNLEVNDEIRQVFDRMLATDAEIAQAEEVAGLLPDFDGTNEAIERLQARKMRDLKWTLNARSKFLKQFTREAREARKLILQEVLAEFDQRPDAIAARAIRKVRNKEGAERDAKLEGIAAAQGYGSVQEMDVAVQALGPVNEAVEAEVDRRMTERYGELSTPEALEKAANEAVYNEAHIRSLATELKTQQEALSERQSTGRVSATGRPITVNALVAAAKQFAEDITSRRRVRDLKSAAQQHRAATARATKRWEQATRKGETKDAIQAQKDRLLNAQAAKSLLEAQIEVEKTIGYLRKFNKDSIRQKLPPEYLDQIDKLLERVDLRASVSGKQIDKRASLKAWIESQNELGIDPIIPDNLLEDIRLTSYKMMTVEEIRGLHDTIRNIEHLGKLKSKLLKAKDKREFDAAATAWADNIRANGGEAVVRLEPDGRLTRLFKGFWAEHRKLNSLVRQMDGGQDGGIGFRLLIASMNEQGTQEDVALEKAAAALGPIFAPVDALPGGLSGGQVYIPEISASLSRAARLAIALNWGNTQNRQRVMDGDGWTQAQVEAVLATLTPTELEFVNKVWEHLDSYWPEIKAKQQRVSGLVEEKVAAEPFAIKIADGTIVEMRGGYYPIKYDPDRSVRAQINDAKQAAMDMLRGAMLRPTTRRGHTKARVDEVYGRPIRKDLAPITQHITQVVHDLAWHEWAIDANRLLADKRIAAAIREHYGPETHRAMTDAVEAIVTGDVGKQTDVDKILLLIRSNVTRSIMGVSATTALLQPFGLTQSMARIGVTPVLKGAWRWAGDAAKMESSLEWIHNKSDFMRLRAKTFNRDLREINQQIQGRWKVTQVMDAVLFAPMQKMQMIADVPTWIGAYEKALSEGQTEELAVAIADEAVLSSQGGGSIKDLSDVQRNHPFLTQFYSYFNATLQLVAESTALTNWKNPRAVAGWVGDMALLAIIPAILPALITYALKGGGEDDEPEDWAKRIAGWQASYLLGMFVGLRDLPAIWGPFDYQGPPAGKLFNDGKRLVQQAGQGEIDDPAVLAAISLIGTVLGLPTTQVIRSYKGWQAWDEGDAPASSILFGPPPKD